MRHLIHTGILLTVLLFVSGCINIPPGLFGARRGPLEAETLIPSKRMFAKEQILVIDLEGIVTMTGGGGLFGGGDGVGMAVRVKDQLEKAEKNRKIKAVILRIDSPGGGVTATDVIHREILAFKKRMVKKRGGNFPVVALMQDIAASGGVYAAMAADEIYATPTTATGSIGVIAAWPGFQGLSDKIGMDMRVIKSSDKKDIGSPWRDMTAEEKKIFQDLIDGMYARFLDVIMDARAPHGLTREGLEAFADGRIFDAKTAKANKLIDGVSYIDEVIEHVKAKAGLKDPAVISYEYPGAYRGNIYAGSESARPRIEISRDINLFNGGPSMALPTMPSGRFMYLWMP